MNKNTKFTRKVCLRCGKSWQNRVANPIECPHCKSYLWDIPKKKKRGRKK